MICRGGPLWSPQFTLAHSGANCSKIERRQRKMPRERRAHRLMANAVYNLIPQFWFLGLTVFTTPFVLHRLGVDAYGILSIITVVAGYLAFLDLGLNVAVIRFIAAHDAKGERNEIA